MIVHSDPAQSEAVLSHLVFISLPEFLKKNLGDIVPDDDILLPLETAGSTMRNGIDSRSITPESLVAGMLRVLAWNPEHKHASQYRAIVDAVRPDLLSELSEAGVAKAGEREWDIAEEIFRALAGLYPEVPEPFLDLAILFEERAETYSQTEREDMAESMREKAFAIYKDFLAQDPPFAPAYYNAGLFFLRRQNYTRAHSLFSTYIKIGEDEEKKARAAEISRTIEDSGYLDNLFKEAFDYIKMGEELKGLEAAREFVTRHPEVWNGWFLIGWACRRLSRWENARDAFEKAVELGADGVDALNELSICHLELGDYAKARHVLEKALRIEGDNVKVITNLGVVSMRAGKLEEASGFFRTALEIEPEDPVAAGWLARIEGSQVR
ncbi:MAG: tetratricopeptide repeat protein [Rectinemataceae bacterium]|nr:tetratricopeptide repeat protein [Rectinemataceae bacterium]